MGGPTAPPQLHLRGQGAGAATADAETLPAMKVYAAQKRGRRELEDLEVLIPAVGLTIVERSKTSMSRSTQATS
jgi:hypothetical protein